MIAETYNASGRVDLPDPARSARVVPPRPAVEHVGSASSRLGWLLSVWGRRRPAEFTGWLGEAYQVGAQQHLTR